jgi:predicted RNA methylase
MSTLGSSLCIPTSKQPWQGARVSYKNHLDGGGRVWPRFYPSPARSWTTGTVACFRWCAGPGFIGFSLLAHGLCETLCLADINPEAVRACQRTIADNALSDRVSVYCSDNLRDIPKSEQWDLAVSNPPHFIDEYFGNLRAHDPHWGVHIDFFRTVSPFLKPGGVIILQENNAGSTEETFRSKIEDAGLDIVFTRGDLPFRTYYFIGIMRAGGSMPFAPVIQREKASEVFDVTNVNRRACRYMTIACDVLPEWRARIPALSSARSSARPAFRSSSTRASMSTKSRSSILRQSAHQSAARRAASTLS